MSNTTERKLALTIYENSKNPKGRGAFASFDQLKNLMSKRVFRDEKDGKSFSPHRLMDGATRSNLGVEFLSMAVADIDDGISLDELRPAISQYTWIATSSFSHTNDHPKFRLVFPLTRDVYTAEWKVFVAGFHSLLGNHVDPSTKDPARFFFLPSCPEEFKDDVFYEVNEGEWMDPESCLTAGMLITGEAAPKIEDTFENEFGAPQAEHPPSYLEYVADRCAQVSEFRDTGCSNEPLWWKCIGVAKHCADGVVKAHEWSKQYPGYDPGETQAKLDNWGYGPTTCEEFKKLDKDDSKCQGCPYAGKITSPIQLGFKEEVEPPTVVEDDGVTNKTLDYWPNGFDVQQGNLVASLRDKDGNPLPPIRVVSPWFYLKERIESHDGTYSYVATAEIRKGKWRDFEIPAKQFAELRTLKATLASYEVMTMNDKLLESFAKDWANRLRKTRDEVRTFRQQGWNKDFTGFLIGDELITANGRVKVRVDRTTIVDQNVLESCKVRGTKEEWTNGVHELYRRENGLPYQYAILTQFASPLAPLLGISQWNGIPLALTSDDSGYGKTTVIQIGINALCDSIKTTLSTITPKAIIARAGQMNNVPVLFDELTQQLPDPDDLAGVSYDLSNGRGRTGLETTGKEREAGLSFKLMASITANKNFFEKLAQSKTNPIATQMRIFEIPMESYPKLEAVSDASNLHTKHLGIALHLVDNVAGVWADDYFKFVIDNLEMVRDKLRNVAMAISTALGGNAARERFYAYHLACVLVAGWICRKIGALDFSVTEIKNWAMDHIKFMRSQARRYNNSAEDLFNKFLSELHGSVIITKHYDLLDARAGIVEVPLLPLRNAPIARLVLGSDKERGKLIVSIRAIDEWCAKNDITSTQFKRTLASGNLLRANGEQGKGFDRKTSISRGVPSHPTGQCRCYEFEYAAVQGYIEELAAANILPLHQPVANALKAEPAEAA